MCLNALTGIDGIWTDYLRNGLRARHLCVLMPLRALMGFGLVSDSDAARSMLISLNALTGIDGIWTGPWPGGFFSVAPS